MADLEQAIEKEFGFAVPVVVRTGEELAAVVAGDPFATVATDPARYLVTFLPEPPSPDRVDALPPVEGGGEYLVRGRELYLWLPDGIANTPLAAWKWDRLLGRRRDRPQLEHRHPARGAGRMTASTPRGDPRRNRFGRAPRADTEVFGRRRRPRASKGITRDRAGGRGGVAVRVPTSGRTGAHLGAAGRRRAARGPRRAARHATVADASDADVLDQLVLALDEMAHTLRSPRGAD